MLTAHLTPPPQKSILRDAVSDLALHYLAKLKILLVKDIERDEIEFTCKTLQVPPLLLSSRSSVMRPQCSPIASVDALLTAKLGLADLVEEISTADGDFRAMLAPALCFFALTKTQARS